jgi:glycosyltransferase involved in cell wall biosynthesis
LLLDQVTPLILTYNEEANIARTLGKLSWAKRIVVIDSGSTDGTLDLLRINPQVDLSHRAFTNFAEQWNFGLSRIDTPWVLSLDADYELSQAFVEELKSISSDASEAGFEAPFVYRVNGKPLHGSLYPTRTVLFRRVRAQYWLDGHTQRVKVDGPLGRLTSVIYHDDRKPLSRWLVSQQRYAREEAEYLLAQRAEPLSRVDRLRLMAWPAPIAALIYVLVVKRCLFDGWPGWYYALQRCFAEVLLALEIIDRRLRQCQPPSENPAKSGDAPRSLT